jgi:hypothetical protein
MRNFLRLLIAIIAGHSWLCGYADAGVTVYFGGPDNSKVDLSQPTSSVTPVRNQFLANLSSYGVESLEGLGGIANPNLNFGASGISATTSFPNGVNSFILYAVSGTHFLWDAEGVSDSISFSQPITAFGSYLVQGGDGSSAPPTSTPTNQFSVRLENTLLSTSKDLVVRGLGPDWPFYNVVFFGVTDSQPFNRISFLESYDADGLLFDDLIAGTAVPEPGAGWLVTVAWGVLGLRRRRT